MVKHPLRRRWIFLAFLAFRTIMRSLPLSVARALGAGLGWAAYGLLGRYRRLTWEHLQQAFGGASTRTCSYVARRVFVNLGKNMAEWCVMSRYSPSQIRRLVDVQGLPHLRKALEQGRGVLALSGHFGNWELLSITLACHGFSGGVLARPLRYPEYEQFFLDMRSRLGVGTYVRGAIKVVARELKANHVIGVVPDQDVDSLEGVFVEFFERPAYTPVGPAALSLMTGAPIVPCFCARTGKRFRVTIEEPITIPATQDRTAAMRQLTQAWSAVVETHIRRHPDQWAWMHRRWKTQKAEGRTTPEGRKQKAEGREQAGPRVLQPAVVGLLLTAYCLLPTVSANEPAPPASETQQMDEFRMVGYTQNGAKEWELVGTGAVIDGPWVTIQKPDAIGYSPDRTGYLTAATAQVEQSTRRIRMEQDVTIHTSDGLWLSSPVMYWLPDQDQLRTDDAVRLETDHMLVRGYGGTGQTVLKHAVIERDIEVVLNPTEHGQGAEPPSHVHITCEGPLSFDYEKHIATFEKNVHVKDRQGDLYSDKLVAYLNPTTREIKYAEALGNVRIVQQGNVATSTRAVYEPTYAKVTLVGTPSLILYPDKKGPATSVVSGLQQLTAPIAAAPPEQAQVAKED